VKEEQARGVEATVRRQGKAAAKPRLVRAESIHEYEGGLLACAAQALHERVGQRTSCALTQNRIRPVGLEITNL